MRLPLKEGVYVDTEGNIVLLQEVICARKFKWTARHVRFKEKEAFVRRMKDNLKLRRIGDFR